MTSFTKKDIDGLVQCSKCLMYSNLGFCWKCESDKLQKKDDNNDKKS